MALINAVMRKSAQWCNSLNSRYNPTLMKRERNGQG